jgi:hypothetical protein
MEVKLFGIPIRVDVAIASMVLGCIICSLLFCNCVPAVKEGMAPIGYRMGEDLPHGWETFALEKQGPDASSAAAILAGNVAPAPGEQLDNGQLFMFGQNKVSPFCCPGIYSGSEGCVCMSPGQANFLNERGGNRTMATVY